MATMESSSRIALRSLAAPETAIETRILSIVISLVSILSILGAGWIMLSFACFKSLRSFRHQLILGLAISDFVMAVNFLSSSAMNLDGKFIGAPEQAAFCSFNGFMTQVFVVQTDYWVLTIAICTYLILAGHKRLATWVQDRRILISTSPWVLSVTWASIGLGAAGYGNIGAWCWFTSDKVRLYVNFIPRWLIIVTMLLMYAKVYLVLFKAHRRFLTFDEETSSGPSGSRSRNLEGLSGSGGMARARSRAGAQSSEDDPGRIMRSNRQLKRLARLMMMYPIAYMLIWTLPTSIRIYQVVTDRPAPFALQTVDKACIVIQGFIDAVIYGVNETSLSSWRNLIFPQRFPAIDGVNVAGGGGSSATAGHQAPDRRSKPSRGVPSSRLSDEANRDDSSISSLGDTDLAADSNSATHIATAARRNGRKGKGGNVDSLRLGKMNNSPRGGASTAGGPRGGLTIHKTVEVNIVTSKPPASYYPGGPGRSFLDG